MAAPEVGGGQGGHKQLFRLPVVRGSGSEHHKETVSRDFFTNSCPDFPSSVAPVLNIKIQCHEIGCT